MKNTVPGWVATLAVCTPLLAIGQSAQRAEPHILKYPSAFADYKPYRDIEPGDWRGLNDAVGAAALKPVAQPSAAPASSVAPPAKPAMAMPSAGPKVMQHGMHGSGHNRTHGGRK